MKKLQCELCGSIDIKKIDEHTFECQNCGVKYSTEEVKKLLLEIGGKIQIDNNDQLKNLYSLARTERDKPSCGIAQKCYEQILMFEPTSWEAHFFTAYCATYNCTVGNRRRASKDFSNQLENVIKLINNNIHNDNEIVHSIETVYNYSLSLCTMLMNSAKKIYNEEMSNEPYFPKNNANLDDVIEYRQKKNATISEANQNYILDCYACIQIMQKLGDKIEEVFANEAFKLKAYLINSWKFVIDKFKDLSNYKMTDKQVETITEYVNKYVEKIKKYDQSYSETPIKITTAEMQHNSSQNKKNWNKTAVFWTLILSIIAMIIVFIAIKNNFTI